MYCDPCEKIVGKYVSKNETPVAIVEKFGIFNLRTQDGSECGPLELFDGKILRRLDVKKIEAISGSTGIYKLPSEVFEDKMAVKYFGEPYLVIALLYIFRKELAEADRWAVAFIRHEGKRKAKKRWEEFYETSIEYCNGDDELCFECFADSYCRNYRLTKDELKDAIKRETWNIKI